ncbi:MAG: DUF3310 domain-containing protein [Abiotrophia sp.]|nr:DUF3310 domain-containing protein [Abiotrophia sp.]
MQGKIAVLEYKAKLVYANPNDGIEEIEEPVESNQTQKRECCGKELPVNKFQRVRGGNYRKTCKACNKKGKLVFEPIEEPTEEQESPALYTEEVVATIVPSIDAIRPAHYRQGTHDLFEGWYHEFPFDEFRAIMKSHIYKYLHRYQDKNGTEDLDKASYCIDRLKEYEERESGVR